MIHVGIVIRDRGAAIVTIERDDGDGLLVTAIERLPFDLDVVANRVRELDDPVSTFVVDAEGLGNALFATLGPLADEERWRLYAGRGVERQALVDALLLAIYEGRFHFAAGLPDQDAMSKAMVSYRRQVREDGLIGSELVVALLLAIQKPPAPPNPPLSAWGPPLFGPRNPYEDVGGTVVGGLRLVRAPDGSLVGVHTPQDNAPEPS